MPNVYTTYATDQLAALSDGSERPTETLNGGNVNTLQVIKTFIAALADPLYLVRLPKGARVIANNCSVDHGAATSGTLTGDVGYIYDDGTGSANAYANDIALGASAGAKQFHNFLGSANTAPVVLANPAWVYVTWIAATGTQASHTQNWTITYTLA